MTGEGIFYAAQAAFSYRGGSITQWAQASNKAAYETVASTLASHSADDDDDACAAVVPSLAAAIPGGISGDWSGITGLERVGVLLVVQAYRRA